LIWDAKENMTVEQTKNFAVLLPTSMSTVIRIVIVNLLHTAPQTGRIVRPGWGSNNDKSSLILQLKSCYVSGNQPAIDVKPITLVLNGISSDDNDDDGQCRVFHQNNSCKVKSVN
jgi:hypothetical protein